VDRTDPFRIFAAGGPHIVGLSEDGGVTWEPRDSGLPATSYHHWIVALFMKRYNADYLEAVYSDGRVYLTDDGGSSWSLRATLDLQGSTITDVTWNPGSGHVFAATYDAGVASTHPTVDVSGLPVAQVNTVHYSPAHHVLLAGTELAGLFQLTIPAPVHGNDGDISTEEKPVELAVFPNPFAERTGIRFVLPDTRTWATLTVFDARGRQIRTLAEGRFPAGPTQLEWRGTSVAGHRLPAGVYFLRLQTGSEVLTRKTLLLR
jgi:hypothetical protein